MTKEEPAAIVKREEASTAVELPTIEEREPIERPVFTTEEVKSTNAKKRGPKFTPKGEMRHNCDHHTWMRRFKALCAKWDRENFARKNEPQ